MNKDLQLILILLGVGTSGFFLCVLWGQITRPETFDRDTAAFLAKMCFGIVGAFIALYFVLKYKYLL